MVLNSRTIWTRGLVAVCAIASASCSSGADGLGNNGGPVAGDNAGAPGLDPALGGGGAPENMLPPGDGPTVEAAPGVYQDPWGNVICDTSTGADCSAFVAGAYDVGVSVMTRLNRPQYNNTVRDLLGTTLAPATAFPADAVEVFDTISKLLHVQPEHIASYAQAAESLVNEFLARPAGDPWRDRYITCATPEELTCQRTILRNFASKAWRRPADDAALAPYDALLTSTEDPPLINLSLALRGVLTSPRFLYRVELDADPESVAPHALDAYELASRLSYFVWGSQPDDALWAAAEAGSLASVDGLVSELDRLLADQGRSAHLIQSFAAQWLHTARLGEIAKPDPATFPEYDTELAALMREETHAFVTEFLVEDLALPTLFTADFTYVNDRLAEHYGMPGVTGAEMRRVSTAGTGRVGFLTQGNYLAGNSNPTATSPVKRGAFVLDRLVCAPPPPPPPGVDLEVTGEGFDGLSVRQKSELHLTKGSACAGCHQAMDPIGLALENFDALGRYRAEDEFGPINASGELPLPDGTKKAFAGVAELSTILASDARLVPCAVQMLMKYGLGRGFEAPPRRVASATAMANGSSIKAAIKSIVINEVFRTRRAAATTEVEQ